MDFKHILSPSKFSNVILAIVLSLACTPISAAISNDELQSLEKDFRKISNRLYSSITKNLNQCKNKHQSLKSLNLQLQKLTKEKKNVIGICLIKSNFTFIEKNIDSKEIFPIFTFLLDRNNTFLANKLYERAKNEGDSSLVSSISFIYARYYLKRKQWKKVLAHIKDTYNDLTAEDANLARLFTGIALQKLKKHRPAVKVYSDIPKSSKHYPAAKLNIAIAYVRQDWWTDAHIEINEILEDKNIKTTSEMVNRLYLILGYSLLHKEFYRDSREAFRNIEIDSMYFNKALLGISLTATNQEDFIGALNAINILKEKKSFALSVDEAYLLLPYIYEKLNQNLTASASYTNAQSYYQGRIKNINAIKTKTDISAQDILDNNNKISIENNVIDYTKYFPVSFLENNLRLDELSKYEDHLKNKKLIEQFHYLKGKHNILLTKTINTLFDDRLIYLNSYMNQARYGLARLFDNSNRAQN